MILRKPYAFFIKHFRLIHTILAVLMSYSLYRTKLVLDFFNEYAATTMSTVGQELIETYMYGIILWLPLFIIIVTITIMIVMGLKKKPVTFYAINILSYIYTLIILIIASNLLRQLQLTIVDVRTTRLVRDLITISFLTQIFSVIIVFVRATGFNIKKFDFKKDLQELQIEESDSEEFEVQLNVDKNKTKRTLRKNIRLLKYAYKENKLLANISFAAIFVAILVVIFINVNNKQDILNQGQYFSGNSFQMSVVDSYLTNEDYKGNVIDEDYYYLILKLNIRTTLNVATKLDTATTKIIIDKFVYTPTLEEQSTLFDFGDIYNDEKISTEYENKTLIYKIPKQLINKETIFSYVNKNKVGRENYDDIKIKINYNILNNETIKTYNLNEIATLGNLLKGYSLVINSMEVSKNFKIDYNYVVSNDTYPSYEYVRPSLTGNYDKAILKIKGTLNKGSSNISGVSNLYDFIFSFGKLVYEINGTKYTQNISLKEVKPQKTNQNNTYYIEVVSDVLNAEHITLYFTMHDEKIEYILK